MLKKAYKVITISAIASLVITGCSVKPEPMLNEDVKMQIQKDLTVLNKVVQPVVRAISLDEAIQRGLDHNLQKRVKLLETALSHQQLDLAYYDMLPNLTASAGYSQRNNDAFSTNRAKDGGMSDSYSVSQEKERVTSDIGFSWNILDFGLSYVRAQQQADKFLIAKEKQKKVEHNLTQEIRRAYYQAVSSQDLLKRIQPMMHEVKRALEDSRKIQNQRVAKSPMEALSYQRELLDILRSLHTLENSLISAKIELAELMGLKPGILFDLADKVEKDYKLPNLNMQIDEMELIALENRPELAESRYQGRISQKELTVAKLKMLPGININTSLSYENSDYLLNNDWYSYGANVSWNLLNVFKANSYDKLAKTQIEISKEQNLALSMAVLSQVHLSIVRFNQAKKEYFLAKEYMDVADDIYDLTKIENDLNINSRLILIKEKLNNILATLRYSSSYANVQNSYGRIFASLGVDEAINPQSAIEEKIVEEVLQEVIAPVAEKQEEVAEKEQESAEETLEEIVAPATEKEEEEIVEEALQEVVAPVAEKQEEIVEEKEEEVVEETPSEASTPAVEENKIDENFYNKNFYKSTVLIFKGDKLMINNTEYIVKKSDIISKVANENGLTLKEIIMQNPWLFEENRIKFH